MFTIERDSLPSVFEVAQEYDLRSLPTYKEPRILDLGANFGVFSWMALQVWPGASSRAYEPNPVTFDHLVRNTAFMKVDPVRAAVTRSKGHIRLNDGARNSLCCSTVDRGDQDMEHGWIVETVAALDLPPCDILKCDTAGTEVDVFETYPHLAGVKCVLVECHSDEAFRKVQAICTANGLLLLDRRDNTLRFVR